LRQIADNILPLIEDSSESLKESVEREEKRRERQKKIEALEAKMGKEKQLNRWMEMNTELRKIRKEMETLLFLS